MVDGSHLEQRAVAAVPHDAFHAALRTLLEPGLQLLDVRWRRVPDADAAVRHQTVERLLLTAQCWWEGGESHEDISERPVVGQRNNE